MPKKTRKYIHFQDYKKDILLVNIGNIKTILVINQMAVYLVLQHRTGVFNAWDMFFFLLFLKVPYAAV